MKRRIIANRSACWPFCPEPAPYDGLSLARNDCPIKGHRYEVKAPGLPLRHPAGFSPDPFGWLLPPPLPACGRQGRDQRRQPVARFRSNVSGCASNVPLPFGGSPLWITASPICRRKARLPDLPDCPSLPASSIFIVGLRITAPDSLYFRRPAVQIGRAHV